MAYKTTSYPLDCPAPVWQALREVQETEHNINDELVLAIAKHVDDGSDEGDLSERQRAAVREVLDGE